MHTSGKRGHAHEEKVPTIACQHRHTTRTDLSQKGISGRIRKNSHRIRKTPVQTNRQTQSFVAATNIVSRKWLISNGGINTHCDSRGKQNMKQCEVEAFRRRHTPFSMTGNGGSIVSRPLGLREWLVAVVGGWVQQATQKGERSHPPTTEAKI